MNQKIIVIYLESEARDSLAEMLFLPPKESLLESANSLLELDNRPALVLPREFRTPPLKE